jgi:hypothetical protein
VALGDPRVADPEWLAALIREEQRRARWFVKWFDAWFEGSASGFDFGKEQVRRPGGAPQHSRRTPEERQEAMKAAHAGVAAFAHGIAESRLPSNSNAAQRQGEAGVSRCLAAMGAAATHPAGRRGAGRRRLAPRNQIRRLPHACPDRVPAGCHPNGPSTSIQRRGQATLINLLQPGNLAKRCGLPPS